MMHTNSRSTPPMIRAQAMRRFPARVAGVFLFVGVLVAAPFPASGAATAPALGTAQSFAVLAGTTVANSGLTSVIGDLGVSTGTTISGFPPGVVSGGTIHNADALAASAQTDLAAAYNNLTAQACDVDLTGQDLGGMSLAPGVYCFSTSAQLTGILTLNAGGNADAVWVFLIGSTLTTASNSSVTVSNGGQNANVFWRIGSSATLGTSTAFKGTLLALTSITLNTSTSVLGRTLARNGAVTLDTNLVTAPLNAPTAVKTFTPEIIGISGVSTLTLTLTNPNSTDITGAGFMDLFPTSPDVMVVATPPNLFNDCGGSASTPGNNSLTLSGGTIPHNGSCTVAVDVTAPLGVYTNDSGTITAENARFGTSAAAELSILMPTLTVTKTASKTTATSGQEVTYTVKILNPNPFTINSVTAIDSLSPYIALKLNSFALSDGSPISGLTLTSGVTFSYSSNNGASWGYIPVADAGGYDDAVTNWKIDLNPAEAMHGNNAAFFIEYIVRTD